ncbi:PREDICTED: uncharacterized protein LOC106338493 [Brassica oleracea var. oleracea]|uniref:uncharacterized protein LOC106338493 n=1 Tax=Brassica oleracea var. oleracea TaxID=109376 RepID=UPI0006A6D141|nr:PREDICTED: uncharacterized protein LOC106338493 [Brassica oleracea var. oleracea]
MATKFNGDPLPRFEMKPKPKAHDDDEATLRLKSKNVHVIWDWNNALLPSGYDMSTLFTKIQQRLQTLDPALTINTVVASGDLYMLDINEADAEARYQILDKDDRVKTFNVPSREVTCDACRKSFPRCNHEEDDEYTRVHAILAREMMILNFNHPPPCYLLLISGDKKFDTSLSFMASRGYKVLLSSPDGDTSLRQHSQEFWLWQKLILGEGPSTQESK